MNVPGKYACGHGTHAFRGEADTPCPECYAREEAELGALRHHLHALHQDKEKAPLWARFLAAVVMLAAATLGLGGFLGMTGAATVVVFRWWLAFLGGLP